ncbi:hypothetical protein NUBL13938_51620 [Klebsiella pneumoniae]|nr:hypothetical protein [Salmonella enterica]GKM39303.1 hypothetical protein NUBL13938_51620 [Klebsiella pneumoniae]HCI7934451.1 hypothetical protein [Klebsiella pneumoniae]
MELFGFLCDKRFIFAVATMFAVLFLFRFGKDVKNSITNLVMQYEVDKENGRVKSIKEFMALKHDLFMMLLMDIAGALFMALCVYMSSARWGQFL